MKYYFCMCNIGVRQGDNLSPILYAPFINDFTKYVSTAYGSLNIALSYYPSPMNNEDIVLLKLFVLLHTCMLTTQLYYLKMNLSYNRH